MALREVDQWHAREVAQMVNAYRLRLATEMTLAESVALLGAGGWPCACSGEPYCCRHQVDIARLTVLAAYHAVKLMAEARWDRETRRWIRG